MAVLRLCPVYAGTSSEFQDVSSYEAAYEKIYKPLGALLFSKPELKFAFYFTGPQIELFKKKNPEFLELLKTMISRKQLEIIGGGYYNPLFPLLFPPDRSGQIEKLSLAIRQNFGKRPRGVSLFADSWDPSLISAFDSCNMEYVLLDSSLLPPARQLFLPIVMSDRGKTTTILPMYKDFVPKSEGEGAENYFEKILSALNSVQNADSDNFALDRIVALPFDKDSISFFLDEKKLEEFLACAAQNAAVEFSLPYAGIKQSETFIQGYVHSGINQSIAQWCFTPYERVEITDGYPMNIYDYLQTYGASRSLYDRMIHISLLLSQSHGDKMRRNAAREKLMSAQSGDAFICRSSSELATFIARQNAYKDLTEAEKLLRECSPFKESVTSYDYNGDGFKEYVCRLEKYNVCIGSYGGSIFELDVMKASGNYADNISRIKKYDGIDDKYLRGIFVDHLFEEDEAKKYCNGEPCRNGLFSAKRYNEISYSSPKQEIQFEARTRFSTLDQPILLKKNYIVKSSGILVQYILRNEGPVAVKAKFAVESNLAELNLLSADYVPYKIELVSEGKIINGTSDVPCFTNVEGGVVEKVSAVQITDSNSSVSFVFTPNEEAGVTYFPVAFKRRNMDSDIVQNESRTFVSAFIWDVDLAAGMEVEKTISLAVAYTSTRKKKTQ